MNKRTLWAPFAEGCVLMLAALVGCGGTVTEATTGAGGSGGSGSGGTGAGGNGTGGASAVVCPAMAPNGNEPCAPNGLLCTYGDFARTECRMRAECVDGKFQVILAKCAVPPDGVCTATPSPGTECSANSEGFVCDYPDGTLCVCSSCSLGPCSPPPPHFFCATPMADCPNVAPNAGTACLNNGQSCTYGFPCGPSGVTTTCENGVWRWEAPVACPQ